MADGSPGKKVQKRETSHPLEDLMGLRAHITRRVRPGAETGSQS